jgi:DNA-binding transcriptional LysR family regulator
MHVETLKTFCDLVETGSFSRAARLNLVTQSAVSQQVRVLEQKYGRRLVERGARRDIRATEAGRLLYAESKAIVTRLAALAERLRDPSDVVSGAVTIAAVYSVGLHTLPAAMKSFLRAHPQVNVRLQYRRTDEVYQACIDGTIDLGVVAIPTRRPPLELVPLRPDQLVLACPPEHRLARRASLSLTRLAGEPFIAFDRDIPTRKLVDRLLRARRVVVPVTMEFDNIETIKRSVEAGLGISILPRPALDNEVRAGTLAARPFTDPDMHRPIGIIYRRSRELSPAARTFLALLQRDLGAPAQTDGARRYQL